MRTTCSGLSSLSQAKPVRSTALCSGSRERIVAASVMSVADAFVADNRSIAAFIAASPSIAASRAK